MVVFETNPATQNVMSLFSFVFVQHFGLACGAALLFLVGVLLAFPVVKHGSTRLTWLPLILFRLVRRMLGTSPGMTRLWSLIFGFNGTVMLLYMASGVHPGIPAAISVLTGYNIAVILLVAESCGGSGWPGRFLCFRVETRQMGRRHLRSGGAPSRVALFLVFHRHGDPSRAGDRGRPDKLCGGNLCPASCLRAPHPPRAPRERRLRGDCDPWNERPRAP